MRAIDEFLPTGRSGMSSNSVFAVENGRPSRVSDLKRTSLRVISLQ